MKRTEAEKNSKFVKMWGAKRKSGRNKYVLIFSLTVIGGLLIGRVGMTLYRGDNLNFPAIAGLIIGGLIGSVMGGILGWHANETKYTEILEKQSKE
jgi:preprotein translocase subunit Sss1